MQTPISLPCERAWLPKGSDISDSSDSSILLRRGPAKQRGVTLAGRFWVRAFQAWGRLGIFQLGVDLGMTSGAEA